MSKDFAAAIMRKIHEAVISINHLDAMKIIEEARQHPDEIKKAFQMMKEVFNETKN